MLFYILCLMKKILNRWTFLILVILIGLSGYATSVVDLQLPIKVQDDGSIDVNVQDQTTPPIDFFFTQINGVPTTVATATNFDEDWINVASVANCAIGDYLGAFNADDEESNRAYFGTIQSITGTNITLDTPLDFNYSIGDTVGCFERNLNVDGSVTRQIFSVQVGPSATQSIDITRLMISFITDTTVSLDTFGDLATLTNGLVLRRVDGRIDNIWNVKNNGEIANLCFDYTPYASTNPNQGQDGAKFRYTFAGQDKHGVAVRLDPGDSLELIIQDDLTGLQQFRVIAEGHYVVD